MVIVDTSVIYKWFTEKEPFHQQAREILDRHISGQEKILIPTLLLYEICNAWATKTELSVNQINKSLRLFEKYNLEVVPQSLKKLQKAIKFSKKYHVTVYDASYAVLAQEKKCKLITADNKFAAKVNLPFIKTLDSQAS